MSTTEAETEVSPVSPSPSPSPPKQEEASNGVSKSNGVEGDALKQRYLMVLKFYRENEGRSAHLAYADKVALAALTQQAAHGPLKDAPEKKAPPVGAFDVIGKDRRYRWLPNTLIYHIMATFFPLQECMEPAG